MRINRAVFGEYGLYDHNVTVIRSVGDMFKVVKLRTVRKKGLESPETVQLIVEPEQAEKSIEDNADKIKLEASISRSKRMVEEYALCNDWDWFITLTIDKEKFDRYDLKTYQKALHDFLHNYNRRCDDADKVRYVFIPEMHQDGAWHMHGLVKGIRAKDLRPNSNGYLEWKQYTEKFGYMSLGAIKSKLKVANYITKYITKSMARSVSEYGANMYYCSKGLKASEVIFQGHNVELNCDWDFERPDGFCKVKWFDDADSFAQSVAFGAHDKKGGDDELTSNSGVSSTTNIFTKGSRKLMRNSVNSFVQCAQNRGSWFYATSCGRWRLKKPSL